MPRRNPNTPPDVRLEQRVRYLPQGIARARAKLTKLEDEARALGLNDLVQPRSPASGNGQQLQRTAA
jgi:hypothetical protein